MINGVAEEVSSPSQEETKQVAAGSRRKYLSQLFLSLSAPSQTHRHSQGFFGRTDQAVNFLSTYCMPGIPVSAHMEVTV